VIHTPDNARIEDHRLRCTLLCGAGDDLRFGQEVGTREARRPLFDLHMEILKLLYVNGVASFWTGECQSTGSSLGLTV
jgi:hypothetical protein